MTGNQQMIHPNQHMISDDPIQRLFILDRGSIARYTSDVYHVFQHRGWRRGLRFMIHRLVWDDVVSYDHMHVLHIPLKSHPVIKGRKNSLTYRLAGEEDLPHYEQLFDFPSIVRDRSLMIRSGALTAIALDGDQMVGQQIACIWNGSPLPIIQDMNALVHLKNIDFIPGQDAFIHSLYIASDYRGNWAAVPMGKLLLGELYERGVRRVFSTARTDNVASIWTMYAVGAKIVGEMRRLRLLDLVFYDMKIDRREMAVSK
jgi:RimJ/RimL family protein N-acetyltransferase